MVEMKITEHYPILESISKGTLIRIMSNAQRIRFKAGPVLFEESQSCKAFPFILEGDIRVIKRTDSGREISLYNGTPGDACVVSAACLLGNKPYNAMAVGRHGAHDIEGIGIGYAPPLWNPNLVDEVLPVKTSDAKDMARRLAREEGLFAGTSSGGNVLAARMIAEKLGASSKVVTLMIDSGLKYLSTDLYRSTSKPNIS